MPRREDADRLLARGSSRGTSPGRAVSLESRRPRRERAPGDRPPAGAELLLRPRRFSTRFELTWISLAALVGVAYISVDHAVPWFLILVVIGRILVGRLANLGDWIALTDEEVQIREGSGEVWSVPRRDIASIHTGRHGALRVEFLNRRGEPVASAPPLYAQSQIDELASALGVSAIAQERSSRGRSR